MYYVQRDGATTLMDKMALLETLEEMDSGEAITINRQGDAEVLHEERKDFMKEALAGWMERSSKTHICREFIEDVMEGIDQSHLDSGKIELVWSNGLRAYRSALIYHFHDGMYKFSFADYGNPTPVNAKFFESRHFDLIKLCARLYRRVNSMLEFNTYLSQVEESEPENRKIHFLVDKTFGDNPGDYWIEIRDGVLSLLLKQDTCWAVLESYKC